MSEVLTRPTTPTKTEREEAPKLPQLYRIEAWSPGHFCGGKFTIVAREVFDIPVGVGRQLADILARTHKAPVAQGLTNDIAISKAQRATEKMDELVGGCICNSRLKFVPVEES